MKGPIQAQKGPAPIYVDACALCEWLLSRCNSDPSALATALCQQSLRLATVINLALRGRQREARIEQAQEHLLALRLYLQMAERIGFFTEAQVLHALEIADRVSRQLGGWARSLPRGEGRE